MRKVIFLDIDGVLQPIRSSLRQGEDLAQLKIDLAKKYDDDKYLEFNECDIGAVYYDWKKDSVHLLLKLIKETDAEIVLSSSWREYHNIENMRRLMRLWDLDVYLTDYTPRANGRDEEIQKYLSSNNDIEEYVVIDDLYDNKLWRFGKNFIYIQNDFSQSDFEKCKIVLTNSPIDDMLFFEDLFKSRISSKFRYFTEDILYQIKCKEYKNSAKFLNDYYSNTLEYYNQKFSAVIDDDFMIFILIMNGFFKQVTYKYIVYLDIEPKSETYNIILKPDKDDTENIVAITLKSLDKKNKDDILENFNFKKYDKLVDFKSRPKTDKIAIILNGNKLSIQS